MRPCATLAAARLLAGTARFAGNFAVWGGLFSVFDCTLARVRRTEDAWNAIISGALTGGLLAMRSAFLSRARPQRACVRLWAVCTADAQARPVARS